MKKLLVFALLLCSFGLNAQNFQALSNGKINFVTFELYKPLKHGTVYYFTDFKVNHDGVTEAYSEVSGYVNITKTFSATLQYNAGLNKTFRIYPVYLGGVSKAFTIGKSFNLSFDLTFRHQNFLYFPDKEKTNGYQLTTTFLQDSKKIQVSGYCDFWNSKYYIFEPQGWYKLTNRIYLGLEWRVSNYDDVLNYDATGGFIGNYANYVMFGMKLNLE